MNSSYVHMHRCIAAPPFRLSAPGRKGAVGAASLAQGSSAAWRRWWLLQAQAAASAWSLPGRSLLICRVNITCGI